MKLTYHADSPAMQYSQVWNRDTGDKICITKSTEQLCSGLVYITNPVQEKIM